MKAMAKIRKELDRLVEHYQARPPHKRPESIHVDKETLDSIRACVTDKKKHHEAFQSWSDRIEYRHYKLVLFEDQ